MKKTRLRVDRIVKATAIFVFIITVIAVAIRGCYNVVEKMNYPIEYSEYVEKYSEEYNVDKVLLYAIIKTESGFDPEAKSSENAMGLTQILPTTFTWLLSKTGEDLEVDALFEPETSIKYGALLINILSQQFSERDTVIAAYHAGAGQVSEWLKNSEYSDDSKTLKNIPFNDTNYYVEKVTQAIEVYEKLLNDN